MVHRKTLSCIPYDYCGCVCPNRHQEAEFDVHSVSFNNSWKRLLKLMSKRKEKTMNRVDASALILYRGRSFKVLLIIIIKL